MTETTYHSQSSRAEQQEKTSEHGASYGRFLAMVGTSTALMFVLMYVNSYSVEHIYWSETRFYMTFVMGATMAVVMLAFMLGMYRNAKRNALIVAGSAVLFAGALWLVRSQETVQDKSWMSAMIPHHSIAIMTSGRAEITDPRVAKLAADIVTAQNREISEMRFLLADIEVNGQAGPEWPIGEVEGTVPLESLTRAVSTPVIAGIRPAPLTRDDMSRVLGAEPACTFMRAVNADPILATDGNGQGVAKVSGALVQFNGSGNVASGGVLSADGGRMTVTPGEGASGDGAELLFELNGDPALAVGFMGYWTCNS